MPPRPNKLSRFTKPSWRQISIAILAIGIILVKIFAPDLWEGNRDSTVPNSPTTTTSSPTPSTTVPLEQLNQQLAKARIDHISDGDSFSVKTPDGQVYKVRLRGVDAPEKSQSYGEKCKQSLIDLTGRNIVAVTAHKSDRYGRLVVSAKSGGKDLALEQIRKGCGWFYVAYSNELSPVEREAYDTLEKQARKNNTGLWRDRSPQAPWEYRKQKREAE